MNKQRMDNLKYSFLMSVYYKANPFHLEEAINSMLNQTHKADEIIIVEDGKLTLELETVLSKYKDLIKIVKINENVGLGLALNRGIEECRNDLIARMDADDISLSNRCEKELSIFANNSNIDIVGSWIDEFDSNTKEIKSTRKVPKSTAEIYKFAKRRSAFNHPTVMYKKSSVLKFNGYKNLRLNQDIDLFGRMLYGGCEAENIQESLLLFRINEDTLKRRKNWQNTKLYLKTMFNLYKIGFSSIFDFIFTSIAQFAMFVMPISIQKILYERILRK